MENSADMKKKKKSAFSKFTFFIFLPLLVLTSGLLIVTTILDINIFNKAKELTSEIPLISNADNTNANDYEEQIISLNAELQDKNIEINQLKQEVEAKQEEVARQILKTTQAEDLLEEQKQIQNDNKRAFKDIVITFETMKPKKAAPVLLEMEKNEAVKILSDLSIESLAQILENMPADKAAEYSEEIAVKQQGRGGN